MLALPEGMTDMAFEAKYQGHCANECGRAIEVGDSIIYNDDMEVEHSDCIRRPERPKVMCQICLVLKPCYCD